MIQKWVRPTSLSGLVSNRSITYSRINYKKKKEAPITASEKKAKNKIKILRVAEIWRHMTVQELATSLEKDIGMDCCCKL